MTFTGQVGLDLAALELLTVVDLIEPLADKFSSLQGGSATAGPFLGPLTPVILGVQAGTMIGFGRAVGETMIVLMVSGNTPILDSSPFNGMRTMSAAIAVEIPEAAVGGTHFRVLFLTGLLLFAVSFVVTTAADSIGRRLRRRYARV